MIMNRGASPASAVDRPLSPVGMGVGDGRGVSRSTRAESPTALVPLVAAPDVASRVSFADSRRAQAASTITTTTDRMLAATDLTKEFDSGTHRLTVLHSVSFSVPQGEFVAIVGPSGSGKTTLLGLLAGLDTPTRGQVILDGDDLTALIEDQRARLRGEKVGFVFQTFQLIPTLTALENVQVPLELRGEGGASERARALLERVGLGDRLDH